MDLRQCRLRGGYLGLRMLEFFQGHGTVAHQRLAAVEVIGGAGQISLGTHDVGLPHAQLRIQRGVGGVQGAYLAHCLARLAVA